ncbi:choice-of-anchor Q domain-containing protein [Pontiellaceae bacterium B1224]|nr:choice-of-anchor Q domain-containing protein [Pontiellaceae bacterium B1224]
MVSACTLINNVAERGGDALSGDLEYGGPYARNCIFVEDGNQPKANMFGDNTIISYSSSINLHHGVLGNITNSPAFINFETGNYQLTPESACIDAGINNPDNGTTDMDGNPRIVGSTIDMGAYEFQTSESAV